MINVLAVDDDLDFQEILKIKLPGSEFKLTLASTEQEFFEKCEQGPYDLFLLDLSIDNHPLKGLELIGKIRNDKGIETPIIVLTNTNSKKISASALELGANDFTGKPIDGKLLISKIKALVQGNQAFAKELEFGKTPDRQHDILLTTKLRLVTITEMGFLVEGSAYVAKGSRIKLKSPRIQEIFGVESIDVYSSGFNSEVSGVYVTTFELDPDIKENVNKVKHWLQSTQK